MVFSNNLLMGAAGQASGYEIDQSIRFNDDDTPILSRTLGTPTDQNKFTYSFWVKPSKEANGYALETNVTSGTTFSGMVMDGGSMAFYDYTGGSAQVDVRTAFINGVKFRDYSAWYHALFVYDSDQGTNSNRLKFYINGVQFPVADLVGPLGGAPVWPSSGYNSKFNSNVVHRISSSANGLIDGYMAEIYFIDGQALDPSSFGEYNDDGVWIPIEASPTYGNNGFYITGETASDLGEDFSGNGNDFTSSGLTSADQVTDSPTDNYATLNPLLKHSSVTLADGNLEASSGTNGWFGSVGTIGIQLGDKVYFEGKCLTNTRLYFGLSRINGTGGSINPLSSGVFEGNRSDTDYMWRVTDANTVYYQTTNQSVTVSAVAVNDIVGCSVDTDGTVKFYKNGTEIHSFSTTLVAGDTYVPIYSVNGATSTEKWEVRFGSTGISHQPTGFNTLNTANLPTPSIKDGSAYFDTSLWTGNDTDGRAITGYNFQPDWVWIKSRSGAYSHSLTDAVRGAGVYMQSNSTDPEVTGPGAFGSTLAFTSDGFTLDNGTSDNLYVNAGGETYVGWAWKANGAGSSNTDGSINTTATSANTTAGFSISTYTGNGTSGATIGHGLGLVPALVIVKRRDGGSGYSWYVQHKDVGPTKALFLDSNSAGGTSANYWNNTAPTSSVFSVGNDTSLNANSGTFLAYCFAEIPGYSSFGSYEGNGSTDGTFVYTGFKPAFIMYKVTSTTDSWEMYDTTRQTFNVYGTQLKANLSNAETDDTRIDILSNGFKARSTNTAVNGSGASYIYMAFAENPFGGDGAAPATAR
jgi:hypothetical protein